MAMECAGVLHDRFKAFRERRKVITRHDVCSIAFYQRQAYAEQYFGALVEETVPYPEYSLDGEDFGKQADEPFGRDHSPRQTCGSSKQDSANGNHEFLPEEGHF